MAVKGKTNNPHGRPAGVPNKATTRFKDALNEMLENSSDKLIEWLELIDDPKDRFDILSKFAEYVHPKLARSEQQILDKNGEPSDASWTVTVIDARARND